VTVTLRSLAGGTALAAGLWLLTAAGAADLPPAAAKAATAADIAELQKKIAEYSADTKKSGPLRTARALTLTLMAYGDEGVKAQASQVLAALSKKDAKGAAAAAQGLAGAKGGKAADVAGKFDLEDVMSPFRITRSGGLGIEKEIRDGAKSATPDPKDAELIGARAAALASYTEKMPNEKATTNPAMKSRWEKFAKDMAAAGQDLAAEGAKGAKADAKKLQLTFKKLDASCSNCHNDFRD
jgi:hypothetical protein